MALFSSFGEVNLDALDATITDNAVDIFVYDTRKDSDGGKWRKRTKKTSWYNETLNTATRGSRRDFPAVAVIVAETDKVTIYDGDDPDLPMWMVFEGGSVTGWGNTTHLGTGTDNDTTSATALNSIICVGTSFNKGVRIFGFVEDKSRFRRNVSSSGNAISTSGISERNTTQDTFVNIGSSTIANSIVNDVAMTVLPNAPIDDATGLPIPTIAVATNGGVSVIKDDGTVISGGEANSSWRVNKLFIDSNYNIWGSEGSDYSPGIQLLSTLPYSSVADIGTGTLGYQLTTQVITTYGRNTSWPFILGTYGVRENRHVAGKEYIFNGARYGLTFLQDNTTNRSSSMVAYATTSCLSCTPNIGNTS